MRTRPRIALWIVLLLLVSGTLLGACGGATPSPEPPATTAAPVEAAEATAAIDAAALLQERCVDCHSLNRATSARHTQAEWQEIVTRMIEHGAVLNSDEEAALVAYLAETYKP